MSRHHIQLPPIIYVPPPKPKKIEKRRSRTQIQSDGSINDTDDIADIDKLIALGQSSSANKPLLGDFSPIDGTERKTKRALGLLSEGSLKLMLLIQEKFK